MANTFESFVLKTRSSVVDNLESANKLYDVVKHLSNIADSINEDQPLIAESLRQEAINLFKEAEKVSKNASIVGQELAKAVLS